MDNLLPAFLVEWVTTKGFWYAILAGIVFNIPFVIVGMICGAFKKIALGNIIAYVPTAIFWFYLWQARGPVGWLICAIIISISALIIVLSSFSQGGGGVTPQSLQLEAAQMASDLPMVVEDGLRCDSVSASGLNITYTYTFTGMSGISGNDPDIAPMKTALRDALFTHLNQATELGAHRASGVVFTYRYKDADGVFLYSFDIGPKNYNGFKGQGKVIPIIVLIALIAFGVYTLSSGAEPSEGKLKASKTVTATVNANVNFRSEPTTGDNIIRQLKQGETITITGEAQNGWTPIKHGKESGWISSEFVAKE